MSRRRERVSPSLRTLPVPLPDDAVEALIARARRSRRRGDVRTVLVLLRQACALDEWRPRTYTLLGVELARQHRHDEATRALNQARWLRTRAGDKARAATTALLAERLLPAAA